MPFRMNGWRRLGLVLAVLWLLLLLGGLILEVATSKSTFFTFRTLPQGTFVDPDGDEVVLPDGTRVAVHIPRDRSTSETAKPWEVDWSQVPGLQTLPGLRWSRIATWVGAIAIVWLFAEIAALAVAWVRRGFRDGARDS